MTLRYVKRHEQLGSDRGTGALTREILVLQELVQMFTDEDGTTYYEWQDVPTVTIDEKS